MIEPRLLALLPLLAAIANPVRTQGVLRVGPGFLPTIQAAIDAAAPGDVVLVDAGVYPPFAVRKPLTITAQPSALVQVVGNGAIVFTLQPADRVHLGGLDVDAAGVTIGGGMVAMERCTLRTVRGVRATGALLEMRWCAAHASHASGVAIADGHLHASDSTFSTAAPGLAWIEHGAVRTDGDGTCELSRCTLLGAWPSDAAAPWPSLALHVSRAAPTARTWLADCTLLGGFHPSGLVGPALAARPGPTPTIRVHRTTIQGHVFGAVAEGPVVSMHTAVDMQIGASFTTTMRGEPGHALMFYAGTDVLGVMPIPQAEQPALNFANLHVLGVAVADAQGAASFPFVVPNDPVLRHVSLWWRGFDLSVAPWQVTAAFATIVQ